MKIAIVTSDLMGPIQNGGVGTACYLLAKSLASNRHEVTILLSGKHFFYNPTTSYWRIFYQELGIKIELVGENEIPLQHGNLHARDSMEAYLRLKNSDYNLIIFQEMHGLGHYSLLAKKAGLEFQNTQLWVMFHGPSNWHLQESNGLPSQLQQLCMHVMEKESSLNADRILFATKHAKKIAEDYGYISSEQSYSIELFPFEGRRIKNKLGARQVKEICFFGRLESRKGLEYFLTAIEKIIPNLIKKQIKISLLGRFGIINGVDAQEYIDKWQKKNQFHLEILSNQNHEESLQYLVESEALVVLASTAETMGYTLVECLQNRIPFICSDIEPFREVCNQFNARGVLTFKVGDSLDLSKQISQTIACGVRPVNCISDAAIRNMLRWQEIISIENSLKEQRALKKQNSIRISLCIPHRNHPEYLDAILASVYCLESQPDEILIYDDASNKEDQTKLRKFIKKYSRDKLSIKVIFGKFRLGVSAARNALARAAASEYIYFLDSDNLPTNSLFFDLRLIIKKSAPDIITSSLCRFNSTAGAITNPALVEVKKELYFFISNDLTINALQNMVGDANFCVKRAFFISIGGFNEKLTSSEDQEFLVRATIAGAKYIYCPKALLFYRVHDSNASQFHDAHNSLTKLRESFSGKLFHPGMLEFMKMVTAWAYSREAILARGGELSVESALPRILPLIALSRAEKVILRKLQQKIFNKTKLGSYSLVVTTSRQMKYKSSQVGGGAILDAIVFSPKTFIIQMALDGTKIKIIKGINRIQIRMPMKGTLFFFSPDTETDLFILLARPWIDNPLVIQSRPNFQII